MVPVLGWAGDGANMILGKGKMYPIIVNDVLGL
jgi:hypothetical protein